MRHFLRNLRKCFPKNGFLLGLCSAVSAGGLFFVFGKGWSEHPLATVLYTFSAYTLTACILWFIPCVPLWRSRLQAVPLVVRWRTDRCFKKKVSLHISLYVGLLLVAYKTMIGLCYQSVWFIAMAFYYAVLSLQRGLILNAEFGRAKAIRQSTVHGICGWLMLLLSMSVLAMRLLLLRNGDRIVYPGHMIYAVALYAFYSLTMAVLQAVRRGSNDTFPAAYRYVHLVSALVSILFLQAALLSEFSQDAILAGYFNMATGIAVALFTLVLGIYMIVCRPSEPVT